MSELQPKNETNGANVDNSADVDNKANVDNGADVDNRANEDSGDNQLHENETNKPRHPQQIRSIRTKESILNAAMELFSSKGFHNTNTKEIAARAGVSTGSFYSYFADKREIFVEALKLYHQQFQDQLTRSLDRLDFHTMAKQDAILHIIDSLIRAHDVFTEFHGELETMAREDEEVKLLTDKQFERALVMTEHYLSMWKDELRVKDIQAAAYLVFEVLNRLVDGIVFEAVPIKKEQIKHELVQMITLYLFKD